MAMIQRRGSRRAPAQDAPVASALHHYVISVAARMCGVHPQTLRHYERIGLISPARTGGNIRLYSDEDIQRLHQVQRLIDELGVNLAGVEVIMNMTDRMERQQREFEDQLRQLQEQHEHEMERFRRVIRKMDKIVTT